MADKQPGALREVGRSVQSIVIAVVIFVGLAIGLPWLIGLVWK